MAEHSETRRVPFAQQALFDLVADVERYPEFLPHMLATRVTRRDGNSVHVDMLLGMGIWRRRIASVGILQPPDRIDITSEDPPFRQFALHWRFRPVSTRATEVELRAKFVFRSKLYQRLLDASFKTEVAAMVEAFERRAREVHGSELKPRRA